VRIMGKNMSNVEKGAEYLAKAVKEIRKYYADAEKREANEVVSSERQSLDK
jgi:hypothetical protein